MNRTTLRDGTSEEGMTGIGTVGWNDATGYLTESRSDKPLDVVLVELED